MTVRRTAALAAAVIVAAVAAPALAEPETYIVDSTHTCPSFEVSHLGFSTQRGRFNATSGKVVLDAAARTGSVEVTIDTTSIDTGLEALEKVLRNEEWFNVAQFPTMAFKGDRMRFEGDRLVGVDGTLTLRGVTRPVSLRVDQFRCAMHPLAKKPACGADASAVIRRSEFGMVKFPAPAVGDEVRIAIQIEAIRQ
jgi:polyisoprenoid-binding protein YceI